MSGVTARNAAKKVFAEFFEGTEKIDLKKIAKAWGVEIHPEPFDDDTAGVLIVDNSKTAIMVNSKDPKERQSFTIAHELGHFHLHKPAGVHVDKSIILSRNANSKLGKDIQEIEANQFAAELLMPEGFLKSDVKEFSEGLDEKAVEKLSKKYTVSIHAMHVRLTFLEMI